MESVRDLLEHSASKYRSKTYVLFKGRAISFSEMNSEADRAARAFMAQGLKKGDRAAVMLANRPEYLSLWFGLNKFGASMVPINPDFTAYEAEYLINHSESKILVIDRVRYPLVEQLRHNCPGLESVILLDAEAEEEGILPFEDFTASSEDDSNPATVRSDDEAAVLYTSGTTGRPKGCVVDQFYYLHIGRQYIERHRIDENDRILTPLPLFHMNAQSLTCIGGLLSGASIVLLDRFHPSTWWGEIRENKATFFHYLGVIPAILFGMPPTEEDYLPETVYGIGAGVPRDIHEPFEKRFNVQLLELYGSTEAAGGGVFMTGRTAKDRKMGTSSFGTPLPGVETVIVDDQDREVPYGQTGELLTRSSNPNDPQKGYMKGYLKDPDATAHVWRNGWFHTGDFCKRDEEGCYYFVDRKKDIIRRSGENISASEVETVVRAHPKVTDAAAIAVPDEKRVEEVKVYVVKASGETITPEEIVRWCEERLAYFKIPRYIEFRDTLPKTSTQKVKKNELKGEKDDHTLGAWDRTRHMKLKREIEKGKEVLR